MLVNVHIGPSLCSALPLPSSFTKGGLMADGTQALTKRDRDGAGPYCIQVSGQVERHWEPELRMRASYLWTPRGVVTILSGELPDQSALLGALNRLAMLGYLILEVRYQAAGDLCDAPAAAEPPC